jgi:hypothetical protein
MADCVDRLARRNPIAIKPPLPTEQPFQFQASYANSSLRAEPGVFGGTDFTAITEATPADGTWRLYGSLTLDPNTGDMTDYDVAWFNAAQTTTATVFYYQIGMVVLSSGVATSVSNSDYGPIAAIPTGDVTNDWTVYFI